MAAVLEPVGVDSWVARYREAREALPGTGLAWLDRLREAGIERFAARGLPTNRDEDWKYSSLRPLSRMPFAADAPAEAPVAALPAPLDPRAHRLVFLNGRFRPDLSTRHPLPAGVTLDGLARVLAEHPALVEGRFGAAIGDEPSAMLALNTALAADGFVLVVEDGVALDAPVELVFAAAGDAPAAAFHPRGLVALGTGARATVIERHVVAGGHLANGAVELLVGAGASLRHVKLQSQGDQSWHLFQHVARLDRDASLESFVLTAGARFSTNRIQVRLAEPGASCRLDGVYLLRGRQHGDHGTLVDHAAPHTTSRQLYKGVVDDQARAVFQGGALVRQAAQKTDAHQLNRTLLLSPRAEIDTKPMLEIYADDVKCGHGATAGDLEPEQLFYMRARGIPAEAARRILIEAFLGEVIGELRDDAARGAVEARVREWMG